MQGLELLLVSAGIFVAVAHIAAQYLRRADFRHPMLRIALGIVPGVVAVTLVLINRHDIVPDDLEGPIWIILVVAVSAAAIIGTSYRLVRR